MKESLVEQPEETAQNAMPVVEENGDKAVSPQVETPKRKGRKPATSSDGNQKISAAPGGGDTTMEEHAQTLREANKEIKRLRQRLEEKQNRELREIEDSRAFFRAGSNPKAQTKVDTTMSKPPETWQGYNRCAALFFSLRVQVDETNDDFIDELDMSIRQISREIGYPLKGREVDWEDITKIFNVYPVFFFVLRSTKNRAPKHDSEKK